MNAFPLPVLLVLANSYLPMSIMQGKSHESSYSVQAQFKLHAASLLGGGNEFLFLYLPSPIR